MNYLSSRILPNLKGPDRTVAPVLKPRLVPILYTILIFIAASIPSNSLVIALPSVVLTNAIQ